MKLSPKWLASLRWLLLISAGLGTLLALAVVVENWRGDRAWAAAEGELRARGEPVFVTDLARPPMADERNYFKHPLIEQFAFERAGDPAGAERRAHLRADAKLTALATALQEAKFSGDFAALRAAFAKQGLVTGPAAAQPAADVLAALAPAAPLLDALGTAARERPDAWLPVTVPPLDHTLDATSVFNLSRLLGLRAKAALALDRADDALADTHAILRLADHLQSTLPSLLQVLVGEALCGTAAEVLQQGCREHRWNDPQLLALQHAFARLQPFVALQRALQTERTFTVYYLSAPRSPEMQRYWPRWIIRGWAQQNKVALMRSISAAAATFDPASGRVYLDRVNRLSDAAKTLQGSRSPYVWFARMFGGNFGAIVPGFGEGVNRHGQAMVACALERHRLAHGSYPPTLEALVPEWLPALPRDVFSGEPIRYARAGGGFTLTTLNASGHDAATGWIQDK